MRIFDVSDLRAEIIRPRMNLTAWASKSKPYAVCNASLYDMSTHKPIGTIIEKGQMVHNDGNGYGFGVVGGKTHFGTPWAVAWDEYLTGYNSPVQDGKYVAPAFADAYVFGCRLVRIGIGGIGEKTVIVTDDFVTLKEFAEHAIALGVDTLVNLDGGGSRHLYYDGKAIYTSPRIPYNAIAFFKGEGEHPIDGCPFPEPTKNLLIGSKGDDVKWLQWHLAKRGYDCNVDGVFGWQTWQTVWAFQKTWSRVPDGICGPNTRRELLR